MLEGRRPPHEERMATFVTSDHHFGHANIIRFCHRPFPDAAAMDKAMVERWNAVVKADDVVWHLGDLAIDSGARDVLFRVVPQLNGRLRLVPGNHDACSATKRDFHRHQRAYFDAGFEAVAEFARLKVGGRRVWLSHYPYRGDHKDDDRYTTNRLHDEGDWLLHGHVHDAWKVNGRQINVGVDVWDFTPVPLETIAAMIAASDD